MIGDECSSRIYDMSTEQQKIDFFRNFFDKVFEGHFYPDSKYLCGTHPSCLWCDLLKECLEFGDKTSINENKEFLIKHFPEYMI